MTPATESAILGNQAAILAEVAEMRAILADVLAILPVPETMTTSDIARRRACSAGWLTAATSPWRLPNFGRADEGDGIRRWRRETVLDWYASAAWETERRELWEKMTPQQRWNQGKTA